MIQTPANVFCGLRRAVSGTLLAILLLYLKLLPPQLATNKKRGNGEKQILIGLRMRGRYGELECEN
jgi:hypothetical protein